MLIGMATIICAIIFFDTVETVLRLTVALFLLYSGINRLISAFKDKTGNKKLFFVNSIILIVAGIALALIKGLTFKIVGLFIIGYSVLEIISFILFKKKGNNDKPEIKEAMIIEEKDNKDNQKLLK